MVLKYTCSVVNMLSAVALSCILHSKKSLSNGLYNGVMIH